MVCSACVDRPDPVATEAEVPLLEFVNLSQIPKAFGGGVAGSLLGGLAWAGAVAMLGTTLGIFGVLAGIGARLGVRAALPYRAGCAWPLVSAAAAFPGYALGRFLSAFLAARDAARLAGDTSPVGLFDARTWSALGGIVSKGFGTLELCWIALAVAAAVMRFRRY